MTNFVIVCYLPPAAQPEVPHNRSGGVLGVLSALYCKLYHFNLSAKMARETIMCFGVGEDRTW